jgi:hypothetical protein
MQSPRLYGTFLLWLLSELFEVMPEVGDLDRPKFVFFFDEAHLLFDDAPKALVDKIEQVVRLIRSKGVGVYFISQNPLDVPDSVLGQLGNRVQHALRAFTPKDQKAVKTAAQTFRPNKAFDAAEAIVELGVGEALVSFLDDRGAPTPVERCLIAPPQSRIGPVADAERQAVIRASPLAGKYERTVDRDSAYEVLMGRAGSGQHQDAGGAPPAAGSRRRGQYGAPPPPANAPGGPWGTPPQAPRWELPPQSQDQAPPPMQDDSPAPPRPQPRLRRSLPPEEAPAPRTPARRSDTVVEAITKSAARTVTNVMVREAAKAIFGRGAGGSIFRGILGGLLK